MTEYIKREDALRQVMMVETRENMYRCMKNIPAADVRPVVRGKWILVKDWSNEVVECGEKYWVCSLCGCGSDSYDTTYHTNFCPNCGADMQEVSEA